MRSRHVFELNKVFPLKLTPIRKMSCSLIRLCDIEPTDKLPSRDFPSGFSVPFASVSDELKMEAINETLGLNETNVTTPNLPGGYDNELEVEDTNWILTSSFIIFTMQTGFGMLEAGCVSIKNEVNIMMKNVVDIVLGGLTYWMFGYGLSFGNGPYTNPFFAVGGFFIDPSIGDLNMGPEFAAFLFQLSFATTATTIVSGAMAERCDFKAYCLFSLLNTLIYCIPAGWVWGNHGFLYNLGVVDIAGSGPVHLIGGSAAFASAMMLGPRLGRYTNGRSSLPPGSPVNAVLGLFVLWWGWLAFNSGSTYGVSGAKWQYAARAAVITMVGSFGGGVFGLLYSFVRFKGKLDLMDLTNSVLGGLVSITAGCFLYHSWEAFFIGVIGGSICCFSTILVDWMQVDDPVGATSVHGFCGIWGVIAVGLFADNPIPLETTQGRSGLFKGGGWYLFGVQCLAALCLAVWGFLSTILLLSFVKLFRHIRMTVKEELLGADITEHMIRHDQKDITEALKALAPYMDVEDEVNLIPVGSNPGHFDHIKENYPPKDVEILRKNSPTSVIISPSTKMPVIYRPDFETPRRNFIQYDGNQLSLLQIPRLKNNGRFTFARNEGNNASRVNLPMAWID